VQRGADIAGSEQCPVLIHGDRASCRCPCAEPISVDEGHWNVRSTLHPALSRDECPDLCPLPCR